MPYVNKPRPYKKEYQQQKARGEHETRMDRQRARNEMDKKGIGVVGGLQNQQVCALRRCEAVGLGSHGYL